MAKGTLKEFIESQKVSEVSNTSSNLTVFGHLDVTTMRPLALPQRWERQIYVSVHTFCKQELLIAFLNGMDVCSQATPLLAFLKRDKLRS